MSSTINITLKLHGNKGIAEGGGEVAEARTQALALSECLKKISKNKKFKGFHWSVIDQPQLRGTI